ncbi:hypothetical protein L9F63_017157, partial [Diploptera punctata]
AAAARMSAGSQVCRPHFHHTPLHPWLSDTTKPMVGHGTAWCSPFGASSSGSSGTTSNSTDEKPPSPSPASTSHHSATVAAHHLFSFPPTPPKDATPDSVTAATTALTSSAAATSSAASASVDYQNAAAAVAHAAAMGVAFMHHETAGSSLCNNSNSLDIKPGVKCSTARPPQRGRVPGEPTLLAASSREKVHRLQLRIIVPLFLRHPPRHLPRKMPLLRETLRPLST